MRASAASTRSRRCCASDEARHAGKCDMPERTMRLRKPVVAAILIATAGIWAVALWAWLAPTSSPAPTSAPTAVAVHMPGVNGSTDRDDHAPSTPQPPPVRTATTTASDAQPLPGSKPLPISIPALPARQSSPPSEAPLDHHEPQASGRTTPTDISTAVVRGNQALLPLDLASVNSTAVVRGIQAPSAPQALPDTGPAVVRGGRAASAASTP